MKEEENQSTDERKCQEKITDGHENRPEEVEPDMDSEMIKAYGPITVESSDEDLEEENDSDGTEVVDEENNGLFTDKVIIWTATSVWVYMARRLWPARVTVLEPMSLVKGNTEDC